MDVDKHVVVKKKQRHCFYKGTMSLNDQSQFEKYSKSASQIHDYTDVELQNNASS